MGFENLFVSKEDGIAIITLNRPEVLNSLSRDLVRELFAVLEDVEGDESVKVVVLKGAGRAFCAGMDLRSYPIGGGAADPIAFYGPWQAIEDLSKPVIAAVHGYAMTGGYLLAIVCDIIIAAEGTKFADTHAKLGLIPYGGETQRLPRLVGVKKAKEMMFTSEMITATEAERYGMVNKVVPLDQLEHTALQLARKIADNNQRAVRAIKLLINRGADMDLPNGLKLEAVFTQHGKVNSMPDEDRDKRLATMRGKS